MCDLISFILCFGKRRGFLVDRGRRSTSASASASAAMWPTCPVWVYFCSAFWCNRCACGSTGNWSMHSRTSSGPPMLCPSSAARKCVPRRRGPRMPTSIRVKCWCCFIVRVWCHVFFVFFLKVSHVFVCFFFFLKVSHRIKLTPDAFVPMLKTQPPVTVRTVLILNLFSN
jgi:hypothetical protein